MTDPDLCLALARAMGLGVQEWEHASGAHIIRYQREGEKGVYGVWNPILGGADFDAVFNWARKSMSVDWSYVCQEMEHWRNGKDELFRRAVCAAIVEAMQ